MGLKSTVLTGLFVLGLAYYFYTPLPDSIADPWKLRLVIAGYRFGNLLVSIGARFGIDSDVNLTRSIFEFVFRMTAYPIHDDNIQGALWQVYDDIFDNVKVKIYKPKEVPGPQPVLMYYHGGGFIIFDTGTYDRPLRLFVQNSKVMVVSVEYRLAPENPFPVPVLDCVAATVHLMRNAEKYGADPNRVGVAGDSAGGDLAAAVAWKLARDPNLSDLLPLKFQILLYPMIQAFDFRLPSYLLLEGATAEVIPGAAIMASWYRYITGELSVNTSALAANYHTTPSMKRSEYASFVNQSLLPDEFLLKEKPEISERYDENLIAKFKDIIFDPLFSPLMAKDLSGVPPAYILIAEFDVLRDDGLLYARRLKDAGVKVHVDFRLGGFHGMFSYIRISSGEQVNRDLAKYVAENI